MTEKVVIPWELKADFRLRAWTSSTKGFMYAIREKYDAAAALEIFEIVQKMDDRIKNLTNFIRTVFKLEGNDAATIGKWWDIFNEICGHEITVLERSKTINRIKVTKRPFKTEPRDISEWALPMVNITAKTINPKATVERPKAMCAGDSYCEYVYKIEE